MKILWTEHATACLVEIEDYIALDDPVVAQRWVAQLIQRTRVLADHPHAGRKAAGDAKGAAAGIDRGELPDRLSSNR